MIWTSALTALGIMAAIAMAGTLLTIGKVDSSASDKGHLESFLLADQGLKKFSVSSLLLSTSFSLNGMLYQMWLGYQIGLWALLVQGAWAISFFLLARYTSNIRAERSLHAFLGERFGRSTQVLAGFCTIIGFTVLIGWEFNVGREVFEGLMNLRPGETVSSEGALWYTVATVLICLIYTIVGGLRSNNAMNYLQNVVKFCVFGFLIYVVWSIASMSKAFSISDELFPPFSKVVATLGLLGLFTNIVFSLAWQFVDMSTWHNVAASKKAIDDHEAKKALRVGGFLVFLAPGVFGTLLGAFLTSDPSINGNNILTKVVSLMPIDSSVAFVLVFCGLIASIMAMIDGLLLSSAYAFVCDMLFPKRTLSEVDDDEQRSNLLLGLVRLFLFAIALLGTLGVFWFLKYSGLGLFDVVYVLIIGQLSLFGAVITALMNPAKKSSKMSLSIVFGLLVGFGFVFLGKYSDGGSWLLESAGVAAMLSSLLIAKLVR
jgi:urea-proton symporter